MSEKQFEENLNYGDCFNSFGDLFSDLLGVVSLKKLDKKEKNN